MKRKRWFWIIGVVIVIIILIMVSRKPKEILVEVEGLERADIEEIVSASGSIESETLVKISSDVSGEITDIFVEIGDTVRLGQPLVRIRPDNYQSAAERARASLYAQQANARQAEAGVKQAELKQAKTLQDLNRIQALVKKEVSSVADLQTAQSAYEVAAKELEAAKNAAKASQFNVRSSIATLKDAEQTLLKTEILSPINGSVLNLLSKKGERVVGTAQMAGTTIMNLAAINDLQVRVQLNENDVNRISVGDPVRVRVDAAEDSIFNGVIKNVSNINKEKTTNDAVTEYEAIISLPEILNGAKLVMLKIGMTASVDIVTERKSNVLVCPVQAVLFKTDSSKPKPDGTFPDYEYVYLFQKNKAKLRKVVTNISNSSRIEILSGISHKDSVITGPYDILVNELSDGQNIQKLPGERNK